MSDLRRARCAPSRRRALPGTSLRKRILYLVMLGLASASLVAVPNLIPVAGAADNAWVSESDGPFVDSDTAEIDDAAHPNRCEGSVGIPFGDDPGWVRTSGDNSPYAPITEVLGQVLDPRDYLDVDYQLDGQSGLGMSNSQITYTDNTFNHYGRDINVFLTPDADYKHLLADGNFENGYNSQEFANMEVEWERGALASFAVPALGDRLRVFGPLIFDCGHGDEGPYAQDDSYRTEIHPPAGWVVYRNSADADGLPQNNKQDQSPWEWYEPTDRQGMAATLPSTSMHDTLVQATVADAFFSSYGGNVMESLNGCDDEPDGYPADCYVSGRFHNDDDLDTWEWGNDIINQDYSFTVPAPPRPPNAPAQLELVYEIEDQCSTVASNPTYPNYNYPEFDDDPEGPYSDDRGIGAPTCNDKNPYVVSVDQVGNAAWNETDEPAVRVRLRARTGADGIDGNSDDPVYASNDYLAFAYRIKVAWEWVPENANDFHSTLVEVDDLHVAHSGEAATDAEWLMGLRVNEFWTYPVRGEGYMDDNDGDDQREPFYEDGAIMFHEDDNGLGDYNMGWPGEDALVYNVASLPGDKIKFWERTYEHDEPDNDDPLPVISEELDPPDGSTTVDVGTAVNDLQWGAHTLTVNLIDQTIHPPAPADVLFGGHAWKDPSSPFVEKWRINGTDPLRIWSDTGNVAYRMWKDGDTPGGFVEVWDFPNLWSIFGAYVLRPTNPADDGLYNLEFTSLRQNPDGKVMAAPYRRIQFELDNTKPTLTVPNNMVVDATETDGAIVDYTVTATDNFDPQPVLGNDSDPTVVCLPPPGSKFPNGQNAPKTTTVACQARDAVGNSTTKTFTVTVRTPHGYVKDYVVLGEESAEIGEKAQIFTGNVGTFDTSTIGTKADPDVELLLGTGSLMSQKFDLAAESVSLQDDVVAGDVFHDDLLKVGSNVVHTPRDGYVPLWWCMPDFPSFSAGGDDKTFVADEVLPPGTYGILRVAEGVKVWLEGGDYYFDQIIVEPTGRIEASSTSTLHVVEHVTVGDDAYFGPTPGGSHLADALVVYIAGGTLDEAAIEIGARATLAMNVYAANGMIVIDTNVVADGAYLGARVHVGRDAIFRHRGVFELDCDTTLVFDVPPLDVRCLELTGHADCTDKTVLELCLEHTGKAVCFDANGPDNGRDLRFEARCLARTGSPDCVEETVRLARNPNPLVAPDPGNDPPPEPGEWQEDNPDQPVDDVPLPTTTTTAPSSPTTPGPDDPVTATTVASEPTTTTTTTPPRTAPDAP